MPSASQVMLDDAMIECFSTLSPKCRDEELEDLVYFILDFKLYQFHGVPVAIAEVDIDQVVVDLRGYYEQGEKGNLDRMNGSRILNSRILINTSSR